MMPSVIHRTRSSSCGPVIGGLFGAQTRSVCYVDDTVAGILALAFSEEREPVNIGNPAEISVLDLAKRIVELTGSDSEIGFVDLPVDDTSADPDQPWVVLVWNDPINLMSYVTFVLQKLFGYPKETADRLMLQVHTEGRAVVANGPRETCELHVFRLHEHGLWATMQHDT